MQKLYQIMDKSRDGMIDFKEFQSTMSDKEVILWLNAMELDPLDVENIFELLAGDDHKVTIGELIRGISRLKGTARCLDLVTLMKGMESLLDVSSMAATSRRERVEGSGPKGPFDKGAQCI